MEESQIIENKRHRLQKLIDMFSHQADGFLLHHQPMDDMQISPLHDYAEYDHVDEMDDSGDPAQYLHISGTSVVDGSNPEDIPLLLPSALGWDWCISHGVKYLAINEAKLRHAQANDSIHRIRLALGFKSALFRTKVRDAKTTQTKTRAWSTIHSIDTTVHVHARNYSMARDAYGKIRHGSRDLSELPTIHPTDLRVHTAILGAAQAGQQNKQL